MELSVILDEAALIINGIYGIDLGLFTLFEILGFVGLDLSLEGFVFLLQPSGLLAETFSGLFERLNFAFELTGVFLSLLQLAPKFFVIELELLVGLSDLGHLSQLGHDLVILLLDFIHLSSELLGLLVNSFLNVGHLSFVGIFLLLLKRFDLVLQVFQPLLVNWDNIPLLNFCRFFSELLLNISKLLPEGGDLFVRLDLGEFSLSLLLLL